MHFLSGLDNNLEREILRCQICATKMDKSVCFFLRFSISLDHFNRKEEIEIYGIAARFKENQCMTLKRGNDRQMNALTPYSRNAQR